MFNKINIRFPLIIIFSLLFISISQPQSYLITKYSTDNGLPDNRVNDIAQDSLGRIWIAMASGIAMYDGYEWIKYGKKDGVPEVEYISIKIDEKGIIWFLPKDIFKKQFVYLSNSQWKLISFPTDVVPKSMHCNSVDLRYLHNLPELYISTINEGLLKFYNKKWSRIRARDGLISDSISTVLKVNNRVYISTYQGLSIIEQNGSIFNYSCRNQVDPKILSITEFTVSNSKSKSLLILGSNWIGEFYNGEFKKWNYKFNLSFMAMNDPCSIKLHSSGVIFLGNSASIYSINLKTDKVDKIALEQPSSDRGARSILIDYEGNLWLSSLRGIYKMSFVPFNNLSKQSGLLESEVSVVSTFNSGKIFFGHNYGFSTFYQKKIFKHSLISSQGTNIVNRILDTYHDKIMDVIYFTSLQKGVGKLSDNGNLIWLKDKNYKSYYSVFQAGDNKIVVSTNNGYASINGTTITPINEITESYARGSVFLNDSTIYLATPTGLELYNYKSSQKFKRYNSTNNNLYSVLFTEKFGLLAGASDGLLSIKNDSLVRFNFSDQKIQEPIYFIIQDSSKNIWLGTNNGVLKWDGKNIKRYNKSDGLAGNETNRAAGFVDSNGNVWIGTDEGVSMYTGNEPDYKLYPPKLMILGFDDASNFRHSTNLEATVAPEKNNLTFHYRGLSFIDEKRNSYQIKLSKIGSDWENEFYTTSNTARFNNLSSGEYIFSARIKNSKGIWSDWQNSSAITIQKYFYQQVYFQLGLILALLFLAYSGFSYSQQKKYAKKLETAVDLRTKNLKEAQVELMTSIDRYKGIVESQTDLVVRVNSDGKFTFVNDAYCKIFGKNRDELIGNSFSPLIHPDDIAATLEEMKKLILPPYRVIIEQRALTINGYRWFSWEDYAIHDHYGNISEIQAVGRDITLQKEVEAELEKRVNERTVELQSLISQSPLGIITFSENGNMLSFNMTANEMFLNLHDFLPPIENFNIFNDEFLLKNNYKNSLTNLDAKNGFVLTAPIKIDNQQNKLYSNLYNHFLVYRIYSVVFDALNKNFVLILDDVTEQYKSEEMSKKLLEEKIRISTIIKTIETERDRIAKELHDGIGQQLTTAKLKLDIIKLKSDNNKNEINEALSMLINAGDEIRRIINDLKPSDVENLGLISSIELLCERIRQASNINLQFSVSNIYRVLSKQTEVIIYRIVQEALNNIVKHSRCSNATIEIIESDNSLELMICDDGIGADRNQLINGKNSFGINNISERIKSLNGEVVIKTVANEGFRYLIKIPI